MTDFVRTRQVRRAATTHKFDRRKIGVAKILFYLKELLDPYTINDYYSLTRYTLI